jgi:hypothetical protein
MADLSSYGPPALGLLGAVILWFSNIPKIKDLDERVKRLEEKDRISTIEEGILQRMRGQGHGV